MCARVKSIKDFAQLPRLMPDWTQPNFEFNPNLAPTESTVIIRSSQTDGLKLDLARFGLVHSWAKDTKSAYKYINTRVETIREKPAFKEAYRKRRCIIPAQGFYEWREEYGRKHPYYFDRKDDELVLFAGLWEHATIDGESITSFSILTSEPNELVGPYHDRMPVITTDPEAWLDLSKDALDHLPVVPTEMFRVTPKNPKMNNPRFKNEAEIDRWPEEERQSALF
jgi:putative SOS response-associated peptidase YedK